MKNLKTLMSGIALLAFLFTSCSKEENVPPTDDTEKATLSFGAILSDLAKNSNNKQTTSLDDLPECSDAAPAYVTVVLTQDGDEMVGTMDEPFRIDLVAGQVFTEEVPELELTPGTYSLDHFMVYDGDGNLIWVAPTGGPMADFVENSLPMDIDLRAGVKKYTDVSVLCYDERDINEYGYQFFDINTNEAIEFCLFGNFCDDTGRHFSAEYSVNVWMYSDGQRGEQIYTDLENTVEVNADGDMAASPLCLALPNKEGTDEYYFEVTLMDGEEYNATSRVVRAGVITEDEVESFFDGDDNIDYYHFRTGCDTNDNVPVLRDPQDDATFYKATLGELNDSEAHGLAYLRLDGDQLETTILATGTTPNQIHPQHIHGFEDDHNSTCPGEDADEDGDGLVSVSEGAPFYGPILLSLMQEDDTWPTADNQGTYTYSRTITLGSGDTISSDDLMPLENRAIVLHGKFVDGEYMATLPVACGQIWQLDL